MKRICVFTSTRADYGLWRCTLRALEQEPSFELFLLVSGTHLSPEFGLTVDEIVSDGFEIARKVENVLSSDTPVAVAKSMGLAMIGYAEALTCLRPDLLLVLGDRYETFCAAAAASVCGIPIGHFHGGETTEGAFDEAFRHSITKMSWLHFVATDRYRKRVVQLGEHPERVFVVGGLGLENVYQAELLSRDSLEQSLAIELSERFMVVTYHPVTLEYGAADRQVQELLTALDAFPECQFLFTLPNSDSEGRVVTTLIRRYCEENQGRAVCFPSLGWLRYLSAVKHSSGVIGNSSSGIIEAPSLGVGTVNIGDRQKGRDAAHSVVHCPPEAQAIVQAVQRVLSDEFRCGLRAIANPYWTGRNPSDNVVRILLDSWDSLSLRKSFFDFDPSECDEEWLAEL